MKLRFTIRDLFWLVLAVGLSALCSFSGQPQEVTHDSAYGNFGAVVGTWKAIVPLRLVQGTNNLVGRDDLGGGLSVVLRDRPFVWSTDCKDLGILPVGTELRIEHLYYSNTFEASYIAVTGSLSAGPYKDRPLELDPWMFADWVATVQISHGDLNVANVPWAVDGDVLEKVTPGQDNILAPHYPPSRHSRDNR
jgi:hypothetical protein